MKRKLMITLAIFVVLGLGLYLYMYKNHRDIASENAEYAMTVKELQQQFNKNPESANKKYADKTIEVYGKITAIDLPNHMVTIDKKLSAVFKDTILPRLDLQKPIRIKGRFVGYDDLLEEYKMDQVSAAD